MGGGNYSFTGRSVRATKQNYHTKSIESLTSRSLKSSMDPNGITLREARDSDEHPNSVPIIIALDVTGSMGYIPQDLIRDGLPNMMQKIFDAGIKDPQVMFLAIGDHKTDRSPLQVGQFESSDELLDKWLTEIYIEGCGGGNGGESYTLAWLFASRYTQHDAMAKRGQKGFLFTIGDEASHKVLESRALKNIMGNGDFPDLTDTQLLKDASELYNVYHINPVKSYKGSSSQTQDYWRDILGTNYIPVEDHKTISEVIPNVIARDLVTEPTFDSDWGGDSDECVADVADEAVEVDDEVVL